MRISDWSSDVCSSDLGAGLDTVHAEPDHEHLLRTADRVGDGVDVLRRIDQPGFLLSLGLGAPQALGQRRVMLRALGGGGRSEGRRVGEMGVSTCRYRLSPHHEKKKKDRTTRHY